MNLKGDDFAKKYKLVAPCSVTHDWNQDSKGVDVCEVIQHLRSLPNYVYGLYNVCNGGGGHGGCHFVLFRDNQAPYNYFMVSYRDRGPECEYPFSRKYTCPLSWREPTKIFLQAEDIKKYGDSKENFRHHVEWMIREITQETKDKKDLLVELQLLLEAMDLNTEMKSFVEKETDDKLPDPKPNLEVFGGKENLFTEDDENAWRKLVWIKKEKGLKAKKIY